MSDQQQAALREYLLAFADDEHFMGQQHTEWIGVAPFLEEDLAFSSIGQDELGHAAMLYELVLDLDGIEATDVEIDRLAYRRADDEYRSSRFTEYGTTDWAEALVHHWIYDMVEDMRWGLVAESSHQPLADAAVRAGREERFHRMHADALLDTLLGNAETTERIVAALPAIVALVPGLLTPIADESLIVDGGIASASIDSLMPAVVDAISARFEASVPLGPIPSHGRQQRSENFAPMMARMREVFDLDPAAVW